MHFIIFQVSWMGTFLSVVLLDVDIGLFIGVSIAILCVVLKDKQLEFVKLVRFNNTCEFIDEKFLKFEVILN